MTFLTFALCVSVSPISIYPSRYLNISGRQNFPFNMNNKITKITINFDQHIYLMVFAK